MIGLYCVCGNRVSPDTGGYTCNRCFRRYSVKGKLINSFSNSLIQFCDRYVPASLTPDFSNAKVGESCFDVELEHCEISEVREYDVYTMLMVDDGKGNLNTHIIYKDGYTHNPLLFNSFAQFTAYWAEKALEM